MSDQFGHETFLSPFTWRYGSQAMRRLWSEHHRRRLWRQVWVALAEVQAEAGLVSPEQVVDLRAHQEDIDLERALAIEAEIGHDVMAEIRTFAEQCPVGGGIIHLGATSTDITDNADVLRSRESLDLLLGRLRELLALFAQRIEELSDVPTMAWTHLQPAEVTTVGYRLAFYAQDLLADWEALHKVRAGLRGKGFKGAVGNAASYTQLLSDNPWDASQLEKEILRRLGIDAFTVTTQVYPRKQDWRLLTALAGLAQSLYKFAFDLRLLQSPSLGEWSEPFGKKQVGSSAMPFKRNPVQAEKVDSLARLLAALPGIAWQNAAHSLLERTLDDSANRRVILPQAFLAADELLLVSLRLVRGLNVDKEAVKSNLAAYGVFAATERVLMAAVHAGGDRQDLHEVIREKSLVAWAALRRGEPNPLSDLLAREPALTRWLPPAQIHVLLNANDYTGDAKRRALQLASAVRDALSATV